MFVDSTPTIDNNCDANIEGLNTALKYAYTSCDKRGVFIETPVYWTCALISTITRILPSTLYKHYNMKGREP